MWNVFRAKQRANGGGGDELEWSVGAGGHVVVLCGNLSRAGGHLVVFPYCGTIECGECRYGSGQYFRRFD